MIRAPDRDLPAPRHGSAATSLGDIEADASQAHPKSSGEPEKVSEELQRWLNDGGEKTLGSLIELFGKRSFAILFVLLLGVPALPLPTGGATHVFEIITVLLALEMIAGREEIWLPARWRSMGGCPDRRGTLTAISRLTITP